MGLSHKAAAKELLFQRRLLLGVLIVSFLGVILWLVAVSTNYWFIVDVPQGAPNNKTGVVFLRSNSGLWTICVTDMRDIQPSAGNTPDHIHVETALITRECFPVPKP
jgi:hypothetical protein